MHRIFLLALIVTVSTSSGFAQQTKAEKKQEKQIQNAVSTAVYLRDAWLTRNGTFNLSRVYLLADGRSCYVFDIGFAPMTALSKVSALDGWAVVQSGDGAGVAEFIDHACTQNGKLRPGMDITKVVLARMPAPSRLTDAK